MMKFWGRGREGVGEGERGRENGREGGRKSEGEREEGQDEGEGSNGRWELALFDD